MIKSFRSTQLSDVSIHVSTCSSFSANYRASPNFRGGCNQNSRWIDRVRTPSISCSKILSPVPPDSCLRTRAQQGVSDPQRKLPSSHLAVGNERGMPGTIGWEAVISSGVVRVPQRLLRFSFSSILFYWPQCQRFHLQVIPAKCYSAWSLENSGCTLWPASPILCSARQKKNFPEAESWEYVE